MRQEVHDFLAKVRADVFKSLGTTALSVKIFAVVVPLLFFIWGLVQGAMTNGHGTFMSFVKDALISWPTAASVLISAAPWVYLWLRSVANVIHAETTTHAAVLAQKDAELNKVVAAKNAEIVTYKQQLEATKKVQLDVRIIEVYILPEQGVAECFVKASIHNLTEAQPITIPEYKVCLTIAGKTYIRNRPESDLNDFLRAHFDEEFEPFPHLVTVKTKPLIGLKETITDAHPVKTGYPKEGWLHFTISEVPYWPVREDQIGAHYEYNSEGEEELVKDCEYTVEPNTVDSIELSIRDPFYAWHSAAKEKPLHNWNRGIVRRPGQP